MDWEVFRHMADSFRWLAVAECSISDLRDGFDSIGLRDVNRMLPNVDVALGASAVVYGRALIEFFTPPPAAFPNDIRSKLLGFEPARHDPDLARLLVMKKAMDAHLAHITTKREHYERDGVERFEWVGRPDGPPGATHELVDRLLSLLRRMGGSAAPDSRLRVRCGELATLVDRRRADRSVSWTPSTWPLDGVM